MTLAIGEHELGRPSWTSRTTPPAGITSRLLYDLFAALIGDTPGEANTASSLGSAYRSASGLRDLDQAQHWQHRSLALTPEHDRIGRAATYGSLAGVAYDRFRDARAAGAPTEQLTKLLEQARADNQLLPVTWLADDHHHYRGSRPQPPRHYLLRAGEGLAGRGR